MDMSIFAVLRMFDRDAAPLLRSALMDEIPVAKLVLPWKDLTALAILSNEDPALHILRTTPNLISLSVHCKFGPFERARYYTPPTPDVLLLKDLHSISVWGPAVDEMKLIRFDLPSIQSASVDFSEDSRVMSLKIVVGLLSGPLCALRSLSIHGLDFAWAWQGEYSLVRILEGLQGTLEELSLSHRAPTGKHRRRQQSDSDALVRVFVAALTNTTARMCLVPRVRSIRVDIQRSSVKLDMMWGPIRRMWESRQLPVVLGQETREEQRGYGVERLKEMYFADGRYAMSNGVLNVLPMKLEGEIGDDYDEVDAADLWARI